MTLDELRKALDAKAEQYNQLQAQATALQQKMQGTMNELVELQGAIKYHPDNKPTQSKKTESNHKQKGEIISGSRTKS